MKKKIDVHDLKYGMWVSELDRPWRDTPFLFQGFEIRWKEDLETLRRVCEHVYIDTDLTADLRPRDITLVGLDGCPAGVDGTPPGYENRTSLEEELETAKGLYTSATDVLTEILDNVEFKKKISARQVKQTVAGMANSIIRNPDAFTLLTTLKTKDSYTYLHALDVCILALVFGRHLGFSKEELEVLGTGTLLLDIGKMRLPKELLEKPDRLTRAEFEVIKDHVPYSVEIMSNIRGIAADSVETAHTHHERISGRGYPRNLSGKEIPIFGKIAAILDCYDAMTSERAYRRALSPHRALRKIYAQRNEKFQDALVEQFIQCIGIYPVGSLVELSTGEVAVVLSQNRLRRLRPKVMVLLDKNKQRTEAAPVIDLMSVLNDPSGEPLEITDVLEPGAYGINPKEFYL